jgi:hypothetical protein
MHPTSIPLRPSTEPRASSNGYFLSDVCVEIPSGDTAVFTAKLNGPAGASVWARAWLSNEVDGTLAETASQRLAAGDIVSLSVILRDIRIPENACIRIESAPLETEQVVVMRLEAVGCRL